MSECHVNRLRTGHRKERHQPKQSRSSTPPAYLVSENSRGELVGVNYNVVWPQFPSEGRFSRDTLLSDTSSSRESPGLSTSSSQLSSANSTDFQDSVWDRTVPALYADDVSKHFAGVVTRAQIEKKLTPTHFVLFYERQERMHSVVELPTQLPLKLGYMSATGDVHSFDVSRVHCPDGTMKWQVQLGRGSSKQPMFNQLSKLVNYYATFVLFTPSASADNDVDCFSVRSHGSTST
ncbi:Protein F32B6.4 [Aphelenchoides avenae]|nr:Protein F32B6.4 [Aphelenchus avenae]